MINTPSTAILPSAGMHYMCFPLQAKVNLSLWTNASKKSSLPIELMAGSLPVFCQSPILSICTNLTNSAAGRKVVLVRWNYTSQLNGLHTSKFFSLSSACTHHNPLQPVTTKTTLTCSSGRLGSEELDSVKCRYFFPLFLTKGIKGVKCLLQ